MTWRGAREIVNMRKALTWGAWYVAEYRLRNMSKWLGAIIAFGLGNPILLLLSVGIGIGSLVDNGSGGNPIDGVGYLVFLAPALLASASIQSAMDETTFPTMQGFVWDKSFFSMNSTQLRGRSIVSGIMISSAIRCVLTVFMFEAILMAFGAVSWESIPALTWTSIIAGISFASVMLAATSFVKQDDGFFAIVGRFIIAPMFMFSGTYYPIDSLPPYLSWIGWVSPVWHATDFGRAVSYNHPVNGVTMIIHVLYFVAIGALGVVAVAAEQHADVHFVSFALEPSEEAAHAIPLAAVVGDLGIGVGALDEPMALLGRVVVEGLVDVDAALPCGAFEIELRFAIRAALKRTHEAEIDAQRLIRDRLADVDAERAAKATARRACTDG